VATTPISLFRAGNTSGPKMDNIRIGKDLTPYQNNGVDWARANGGGISTFDKKKWPTGAWWLIPANTVFDDRLSLVNDHGDHWSWQPALDMELAEFARLLSVLSSAFQPA
jgi:hypothetical protein